MFRIVIAAASLALLSATPVPRLPMPAPGPGTPPGAAPPARTLLPVKDVMRHIVNPFRRTLLEGRG